MPQPIRIAVKLQPQRDANGQEQFRATLPMGVLFEKNLDAAQLGQERAALEENYGVLVEKLRALRRGLKQGPVVGYWLFGDTIVAFENETAQSLLFVDKLSEHLARDVAFSKTMIDLCRRFRLKVPDQSQIDPQITFSAYHRSGFNPQRAVRARRKA